MECDEFVERFLDCEPIIRKELSTFDLGYHSVEDIIQDAWVKAWSNLDSFREGTNFRAWVVRIAKNKALNIWNRRKNYRRKVDGDPHTIRQLTRSDPPTRPDGIMDDFAYGERVHELLKQLPLHFRFPLMMFEMEGMSYKRIARAMNCPVGSVMSRLHRARHMFRDLAEHEFSRNDLNEAFEDPYHEDAWQSVEPDFSEAC